MQTSIEIVGVEIYGVYEGLAGSGGMLLLNLQQPQAVVGAGEIRTDPDGLPVFVLRGRELSLHEVLVPFFDLRSRSHRTPASRENCEQRGQKKHEAGVLAEGGDDRAGSNHLKSLNQVSESGRWTEVRLDSNLEFQEDRLEIWSGFCSIKTAPGKGPHP